jgi:hypothetical protein
MKHFKKLRTRIGYYLVKKQVNAIEKRSVAYNDLKSAKTIGVLFDATQQESYLAAKKFIEDLRTTSNSVLGLGYVSNQEAINYFPYHQGIDFFALTNTNWYFRPIDKCTETFAAKNFDVFIDLSTHEILQVRFLVTSMHAKLKIGRGKPSNPFYDFLIDLKEGIKLDQYINQIIHYMSAFHKA